MHPTLFDPLDPGLGSYLRKFEEECHLLSLARHPNIVQYLATHRDPETRLPVLLMELCDESLTGFLERSPCPLPYHTQLNISHDIAMALVYLHSNGLIHRDLTGNNVLMIAGTRAKIIDFGMSKLVRINPRATPLTTCPGNILYMAPEALDESPSYTDKLDTFSFGVLLIQILTRKFPSSTDRFRVVNDPRYGVSVRVPVPEVQRRQAHLTLIADTHPLKPIAVSCIKDKDTERPSAKHLSGWFSRMKQTPKYNESKRSSQTDGVVTGSQDRLAEQREEVERLQQQVSGEQQRREELVAQVQQVEQQLHGQRVLTNARTRENARLHQQLQQA